MRWASASIPRRWSVRLLLAAAAWWALAAPASAGAQADAVTTHVAHPVTGGAGLPFAVGERLTYTVHAGRLGQLGRGSMWVTDTASLRERAVWVLHFRFQARKGPIRVVNRSESWIDPQRMASLRFHKHERHPLSNHDEQIEMFPAEQRWEGADGSMGASLSNLPLDELSFIYFLRTLPLDSGTTLRALAPSRPPCQDFPPRSPGSPLTNVPYCARRSGGPGDPRLSITSHDGRATAGT